MDDLIQARVLVPGKVKGELVVSREPLSFWGGYDPATGEITDRRHPLSGVNAAGKILALPFTRGSSTTTAVILEAQRRGKAPMALMTSGIDTFLALASVVADELYHQPIPVFVIAKKDLDRLHSGEHISVDVHGTIQVMRTG